MQCFVIEKVINYINKIYDIWKRFLKICVLSL